MAISRPASLLIRLDGRLRAGLQQQIYGSIRRAILDGVIAPGTRLPSSRALAVQQLQAEGYLTARRGSGTSVAAELPDDLVQRRTVGPTAKTRHPTLSRRGAALVASSAPRRSTSFRSRCGRG
jgi:GntR family transcriptional regulator/MocR family aminotransferase